MINFTRGNKLFEINNHLGNVMATVSDRTLPEAVTGTPTAVRGYTTDIVTASDYYPFGMVSRAFNSPSVNYRYGFNGKEVDNEMFGIGNELDYGMRVYDPRVGRFLSVDPLTSKFPWWTPYQFAGNTPINTIDLDGAEVPSERNKNVVEGGSINGRKVIEDANGTLYYQGKAGDNLGAFRYVNNDLVSRYLGGVLQPKHVSQALNFADAVDGYAYQTNKDATVYGPYFETGKSVSVKISSESVIVTKTIEALQTALGAKLDQPEIDIVKNEVSNMEFVFSPGQDQSNLFAIRVPTVQLARSIALNSSWTSRNLSWSRC